MVVVNRLPSKPPVSKTKLSGSSESLGFLTGSLSSKRLSRQFPILASIHKATDGALIGVLLAIGLMSTLTLHWQNLWTVAFSRLEMTRNLAHRLTDSTAMLERHLLESTNLPLSMVPTKAAHLVYIEAPDKSRQFQKKSLSLIAFVKSLPSKTIEHGY